MRRPAGFCWWRASAATSLNTGTGVLTVNYKDHGGEAVFTSHGDDDYMAEVDINLNSGTDGAIYFRYLDPDNWYRAVIRINGAVQLEKMLLGKISTNGTGHSTHNRLKSPTVRSSNGRRNEMSWPLLRFRDSPAVQNSNRIKFAVSHLSRGMTWIYRWVVRRSRCRTLLSRAFLFSCACVRRRLVGKR